MGTDSLDRLLAVNGFLPHGYCISWTPTLLATFAASDVLIFLSYFSMPVALAYFSYRRVDFPYRWLLVLFAAFIMACGLTHLLGAIVLWYPLYWLEGMLKLVTAGVSVVTAIMLWPLMPHALRLPSPSQLRLSNEELQREVAERKRIAEALRQAKEAAEQGLQMEQRLMAAIVESSDDAIIGKSLDGTITSWNRAAQRIFGYSRAEMIGQPILAMIPPEHRDEEEMILGSIRRGEAVGHFETERLRKDGSIIPVSITVSPIRDSGGRIVGASKIARDISEHKRAERALQRSNADLERFAYTVSHDMRQPLRAVTGHLQLLDRGLRDTLDADNRENLAYALDGAKRMDEMIVSLLDYSRVGRKTESMRPLDSRASLDEALGFLAPLIEEAAATVEVGGEWPRVFASRDELTRLFQNLVGNALKYRQAGRPPRIDVSSAVLTDAWRVSVRDNGIGIDPQQIDRLFQFFSRLQPRSRFEGTGMGLALCRRIVEHHAGRIWAESAGEGQGSVFSFEIPLRAALAQDEPPPAQADQPTAV